MVIPVSSQKGKSQNEPQTWEEAMAGPDAPKWQEAAKLELTAHAENGTWEIVKIKDLPAHTSKSLKALGSKWVFKRKVKPSNTIRYKARLVIKGFQQREGIDYKETFAPILNFRSLRTLLALAAYLELEVHHVDVKTAFLNSTMAGQADVYMDIPKGYEGATKGVHVLKLLKSQY